MRKIHCIVALLVLASAAVAGQAPPPQPAAAEFTVFIRGVAIGVEQVTVSRTADAFTVSGTERLGAPLNVTVRRAEIRYSPDGHPQDCAIEGSVREEMLVLHTAVAGTTATTTATQGTRNASRTDEVAADTVVLPNVFFGAYEALSARLVAARAGDELRVLLPTKGPIGLQVLGVSEDRIRTLAGLVQVRRHRVRFADPARPIDAEIWAEPDGRLVRVTIPEQAFDLVRSDVASVTARREIVTRPNDEQVHIPSNGFSLAGTLSKPASSPGPRFRFPAIVLVSGVGTTDRDEMVAGVPIFGQLASAVADAGFIVVRYDNRGIGQSGGRMEAATLADYADDVTAAVKYLRHRKDVDPRRVVVLGHGGGGAIALRAAARDGDIAGLVLVAAPGGTGAAFTLEQQRHALSLLDIPDAEKQARIALQQKIQQAVITGQGLDGLPADLRRQADTPWFRSFLAFDPAREMSRVHQPILVIQGALDRETDPSNADRLEAMARARKGTAARAVQVVKLPGINHLLVPATTGELNEYDRLADKTVSRDVAPAIENWLKANTKVR